MKIKKALIAYQSRKGTTKYFGHNIGEYLKEKNIEPTVISVYDAANYNFQQYDYILLGCWTHGLFIIFQHPDKEWVKFAKKLPDLKEKKVGLFATYKLATGSMFRNMEKPIADKIDEVEIVLKAKGEELGKQHKAAIDEFIKAN